MTRLLSILLIAFCLIIPTVSAALAQTAPQTKEKAVETYPKMNEQRPETGRSATEPGTKQQNAPRPEMGSQKEEEINTLKGVDPAVK